MLAGEAGVGKTRIAAEFSLEASEKGVLTLVGACYDRDDPLSFVPFVEMLETMLAASRLAEVREALGEDIAEIARLLPQLRRLFPDIPAPLELPPEQSRRVLFNAVARVLARMSTKQPVLLVLDDLHWADEGTLSLVTHLGPLVSKMPVLIVGTYRDFELQPAGPLAKAIDELIRYHVLDQMSLSGLPKPAVAKMIEALGGREPPEEIASLIYSETEGNPFFIEELLRHLVEQDQLLDKNGGIRRDLKFDELNVPRTVRLVIGRRVTRLSDGAQKTLATAAVIGRAFTFELLRESSHANADSLLDWIEEGERAGLIASTFHYPEVQFRFSHELIRQTVASELSSARRQVLHLMIADAIERVYANTLQDHIYDLAHHLWGAGSESRARAMKTERNVVRAPLATAEVGRLINCLTVAAKQASSQGAYEAAICYLRNGLEAIQRLPPSERVAEELRLQIALTGPLTATKGYTAPEVEKACSRALELSQQIGERPQLFEVLARLYSVYANRGALQKSLQLARDMLRLAKSKRQPLLLLWAHYCLGHTLSLWGELEAGRVHTEQSLALYDFTQPREYGFIQDPGATGLARLAHLLYLLGYPDQALGKSLKALAHARKLSGPFTLAWVLGSVGEIHARRGEFEHAETLWAEQVVLCAEHNFPSLLASGIVGLGWSLAEQGRGQEAISRIREGLNAFPVTHAKPEQFASLLRLVYAYRRLGWSKEGLAAMVEALKLLDETDIPGGADLYYLKGEMLVIENTNNGSEAQQCFRAAIEIARSQKARTKELKAVTSIARVLVREGRRDEARAMLAEIYNWFTEGFDTADLLAAKALLNELSA
jgi:predicted ATPase